MEIEMQISAPAALQTLSSIDQPPTVPTLHAPKSSTHPGEDSIPSPLTLSGQVAFPWNC